MKKGTKWLWCLVIAFSLILNYVPVQANEWNLNSLEEDLLIYYNFDGDDMYENSGVLGSDFDCYPTLGDFFNPEDAESNGTVDSYRGLGKAADLVVAGSLEETSFIQFPGNVLSQIEEDLTVSFWYAGSEAEVTAADQMVATFIGNGIAFWLDFRVHGGFVEMRISDNAGTVQYIKQNAVSSNGWHMYTLTIVRGEDTDTVNFYVDGALVQSATFKVYDYFEKYQTDSNLVDQFNSLGGSAYWTPVVDGAIDEFRLYSVALSDSQVAMLYTDPFKDPVATEAPTAEPIPESTETPTTEPTDEPTLAPTTTSTAESTADVSTEAAGTPTAGDSTEPRVNDNGWLVIMAVVLVVVLTAVAIVVIVKKQKSKK